MKKKWYIITLIIIMFIPNNVYAENQNDMNTQTIDTNAVLEEQQTNFGIRDFLKEAENYVPDFISNVDISNIFNMALNGKIDNASIMKKIFDLLVKQIKEPLKILVNILLIVLIHSILKSMTDGLENSEVSKIIYYVQYILIVTIIMSNFSAIVKNVNDAIENLVGFSQSLIPLLISLMVYTGSITTTTVVEPILLFLIEFISNMIKTLIIPVVSIITVMIIISKITERIQISKLAKFFKSSIVWALGIVLTLFVGIVSLEGSLTSSVDGLTAKTAKAAVSTLIPVVRKNTRRRSRCNIRLWSSIKKCGWYSRSNYNYRNMYSTYYEFIYV